MKYALVFVALIGIVAAPAFAGEQFLDSDGVKIRYWEEGKGDTVLLIHGYTANGNLNWRAPGIEQALADDGRQRDQ